MIKVHGLRTEFICLNTKEECQKNILHEKEEKNIERKEEFKNAIPNSMEGGIYGLVLSPCCLYFDVSAEALLFLLPWFFIAGFLIYLFAEVISFLVERRIFVKYMALPEDEKIKYLKKHYRYKDRLANIDSFFAIKDKCVYSLTESEENGELSILYFNENGDGCEAVIRKADYSQDEDIDEDLQIIMDGYGNVQIRSRAGLPQKETVC